MTSSGFMNARIPLPLFQRVRTTYKAARTADWATSRGVYNIRPPSRLTGHRERAMRTAVYALAGLAAASGVSAFMPQTHFAGRAPSLRAARSARPAVSVGEALCATSTSAPAPSPLRYGAAAMRTACHRPRSASPGGARPAPGAAPGGGAQGGAYRESRLVGSVRGHPRPLHLRKQQGGGRRSAVGGVGPVCREGISVPTCALRVPRACRCLLIFASLSCAACAVPPQAPRWWAP